MYQGKVYIAPFGAALTLFAYFAMPMLTMMGMPVFGSQIGGRFHLVLVAAIAIIAVFLYFRAKENLRSAVMYSRAAAIIGLIGIVLQYFDLHGSSNPFAVMAPGYGLHVAALGLIAACIVFDRAFISGKQN